VRQGRLQGQDRLATEARHVAQQVLPLRHRQELAHRRHALEGLGIERDTVGGGITSDLLSAFSGDASDLGIDRPVQVGRREIGTFGESVAGQVGRV
jgi:hypothetical protein